MKVLFFILAYTVIVATVLPLFPTNVWWVRALEFPRYQLVLVAFVAFIFLVINREFDLHTGFVSVLLAAAVIYQMTLIFPYTFLAKKQVKEASHWKEENSISLIISNVLMDNKNSSELINMIRQKKPDIVLAVETNRWWIEKLNVLKDQYEYSIPVPLDNTYGMVLYSKLEITREAVKCLVESDIPSIHVQIVLASGKKIEGRFLHPRPPAPQESDDTKERDAELLIIGKEVRNLKEPVIVAGDLNDVAWSETTILFQKVSKLLDPRIGRGFYNTFHADYYFFRWPLDYVFHSNHFKLVKLERLPSFGSDHFPMYAKFAFIEEAQFEQEEPDADKEDKQKTEEKIKEGVNDPD